MRFLLEEYEAKFGELDTWGLPLSAEDLDARLLKALEEDKPIDFEAEYGWTGTKDLPKGTVA